MATEEAVAVFRALADPTRLRLLALLCGQREPDALCVNALAQLLGVTQSAVSQHLRVLKGIGLVKGQRRRYHIHYFVKQDALERCRQLASKALSTEGLVDARKCARCGPGWMAHRLESKEEMAEQLETYLRTPKAEAGIGGKRLAGRRNAEGSAYDERKR